MTHLPENVSDDVLDQLVGRIYDAVTALTGFQGFVEQLTEAFHLKAAMIVTANVDTLESKGLWVAGMDMQWIERYAVDFADEDMLARHIQAAPPATFYASNLDLNVDEYITSRFYREWVLPQHVTHASAAVVLKEGPWCSQIVMQRGPGQALFSRDELTECKRLLPHLQRAMQMRQRFSECNAGGALSAGLDLFTIPSVLIDEFGQISYINKTAQELLQNTTSLRVEGRHLYIDHANLTRQLNYEIIAAVRASRGEISQSPGLVVLPRAGGRPLILMVSPLRRAQGKGTTGSVILFFYDSQSTPSATVTLVKRLFQLTAAEADLAVILCAGHTLDDAAAQRKTSVHTVRSQLKSLFIKTGTNRQADLIVLLLSSPAYFLTADAVHRSD